MTRIQLRFKLESKLDDAARERIADAHSIYGVEWIKVEPATDGNAGSSLLVEFDATRLKPPELESALRRRGLAVLAFTREAKQ